MLEGEELQPLHSEEESQEIAASISSLETSNLEDENLEDADDQPDLADLNLEVA